VDPSVEFGLRFESNDGEDAPDRVLTPVDVASDDTHPDGADHSEPAGGEDAKAASGAAKDEAPAKKDADIVSLDSFRK